MPGMAAAAFHQSLDGKGIAEIVQWESERHLKAAFEHTEFDAHAAEVLKKVIKSEFSPYTTRYVDAKGANPSGGVATVSPEIELLTVIAKFDIDCDKQLALLDLLIARHEASLKDLPGFLSVSFLTSPDGEKVVEYVQFEKQAFEIGQNNFEKLAYAEKIAGLVRTLDVRFCEVMFVSVGLSQRA